MLAVHGSNKRGESSHEKRRVQFVSRRNPKAWEYSTFGAREKAAEGRRQSRRWARLPMTTERAKRSWSAPASSGALGGRCV